MTSPCQSRPCDKTYSKKVRCSRFDIVVFTLKSLRKQHKRYRVRGRYTPENFKKQADDFYILANQFRVAEKKRGCDHDKTRLGCGCNPTFWDAFHEKYPKAFTTYYNDVTMAHVNECAEGGHPVDYFDIYIYA